MFKKYIRKIKEKFYFVDLEFTIVSLVIATFIMASVIVVGGHYKDNQYLVTCNLGEYSDTFNNPEIAIVSAQKRVQISSVECTVIDLSSFNSIVVYNPKRYL